MVMASEVGVSTFPDQEIVQKVELYERAFLCVQQKL